MRLALIIALPLLALTSTATAAKDPPVIVTLANFNFAPTTLRLEHGRTYVVRLLNDANGGHNFVAKRFFAAATMLDAATRAKIRNGGVEVAGHGAVELHLTAPPAGRYPVKCSHFLHSAFGMKGEIIVN